MKVLLTRRLADGQRSAELLKDAGLEPVLLPLSKRVATGNIARNKSPDFLIFTSAAGVENIQGQLLEHGKEVICYGVGPRTAGALAAAGYTNIRQGDGNASQLTDLVIGELSGKKSHGVYFCGEERAFDIPAALAGTNIELELCATYRNEPEFVSPKVLKAVLTQVCGGIIGLYSPKSAAYLFSLIEKANARSLLSSINILAISQKTAAIADKALVNSIQIAATPDEPGMVAGAVEILKRH